MTTAPESATAGIHSPTPWHLELPAGMFLLNDNQRLHFRKKAEHIATIRNTTTLLARAAKIPALQRAYVQYLVHPPTKGERRRDPGNWSPTAKACMDGLVDAGVLPDDNSTRLLGPDPRIGAPRPKLQIALIITDLDAMHPDHIALLTPSGASR